MRKEFAKHILAHMKYNDKIWVIVGDLGYGIWDEVRHIVPDRFINVGAAEQAMVDIGIGLALEGRVPIIYTIAPFLLYRPFESIRTYINHEHIPVKLVASGRDKEYAHDGISHWSHDAKDILHIFPHISTYFPHDTSEIESITSKIIVSNKPDFVSLKR